MIDRESIGLHVLLSKLGQWEYIVLHPQQNNLSVKHPLHSYRNIHRSVQKKAVQT